MRVRALVVACAVAVAGCATSESPGAGGPSGVDARGARGGIRRAPDAPSPPTSGARYALRIDAARAGLRAIDLLKGETLTRPLLDALAISYASTPALREAQRVATKEFPHPFASAAFGLTGSPR